MEQIIGKQHNPSDIQSAVMDTQLFLDNQHRPIPWDEDFWKKFWEECAAMPSITSYEMVVKLALGKRKRVSDIWHCSDLYTCTEHYLLNPYRCVVHLDGNSHTMSNVEYLGYQVIKCEPETDETITDVATNYSDFRTAVTNIFKHYLADSIRRRKTDEFASALEQCVRAHSVK